MSCIIFRTFRMLNFIANKLHWFTVDVQKGLYIPCQCHHLVLHSRVKGKIEKFPQKSEKPQEYKHILSRLENPFRNKCCVHFRVIQATIFLLLFII